MLNNFRFISKRAISHSSFALRATALNHYDLKQYSTVGVVGSGQMGLGKLKLFKIEEMNKFILYLLIVN